MSMTQDVLSLSTNQSTRTSLEIAEVCDQIKELLISKNQSYGDSALNPSRIFSKSSAIEQILVRIDDKLSRISKGAGVIYQDEDVVKDLIGYLVLLKVAQNREKAKSYTPAYEDVIVFSESSNWLDPWDGNDIEPSYFKKFQASCPD